MQNYLLTLLINDKVDEKGRQVLVDDVKKNFTILIKEDLWGIRTLAYEIKHMDKAFYAYFEFEAEPQSVITLDKNIRLNEDIIRHLIVKAKKAKRQKGKKAEKKEAESQSGKETEVVEMVADAKVETKEKPAVKKTIHKVVKKA